MIHGTFSDFGATSTRCHRVAGAVWHCGMADRLVEVVLDPDATLRDLPQSPSVVDGLSSECEMDLRIWGCLYIQQVGVLLDHPQVVMACAQIMFQRFFCRKSMVTTDVRGTAIACLFLAGKVEESIKRLRSVITTAHNVSLKQSRAFVEKGARVGVLDIESDTYGLPTFSYSFIVSRN